MKETKTNYRHLLMMNRRRVCYFPQHGFTSVESTRFSYTHQWRLSVGASSPQPVFALRNAYVGKEGFAGGYFYDRMEAQNALSSALKQIFAGEDARNILFTYSKKSYPFINYQQLQMDGLDTTLILKTRYSSINRLHSGRSINGGLFCE